jgi:hypothetical protein
MYGVDHYKYTQRGHKLNFWLPPRAYRVVSYSGRPLQGLIAFPDLMTYNKSIIKKLNFKLHNPEGVEFE